MDVKKIGHMPDGGWKAYRRQHTALWERQDARGKTLERKRFQHQQVGPVTLTMQPFDVRSIPGEELVVYHADPGSASEEALALLGSVSTTARPRS